MSDNLKEREAFEQALSQNQNVRFWNTTDAMFWAWCAAIEADRVSRDVPATQDVANLLSRFEHQWHRMGELWERYQGKGWPDKEGAEFNALRDEKAPATRAKLIAMLAASPQPQPVQAQPSEQAQEQNFDCPLCGDGFVLGSRTWIACAQCHGSGRLDVLGDYIPNTAMKKTTNVVAQPKPANQQED